jgi:Ni,Fe-hydrogenase III large subunit
MSTEGSRLITLTGHATRGFGDAPLQRVVVDSATWEALAIELAHNPQWSLLAHWAEPDAVHLALLDMGDKSIAIVTLPCPEQKFPSIGRHHAPAIRLERSIRDLYGIVPEASPDPRPWLDHGCWERSYPLSSGPTPAAQSKPYPFLTAEGAGVHRIAVGPVHAGIIEPGHFRFSVNGETVVRMEERLGYVHKGIESLWVGADITRGAQLAARLSGDSTVAASLAFARAVEAALGVVVPDHAQWQRALMAELERIANHLGDIGAICNDASFALMQAHCGVLREHVLRACRVAYGHRLMMDRIVPGGVAADLRDDGIAAIMQLVAELEVRFPPLVELYDNTPSLLDRTVGTGRLSVELAARYAAGGYVGRASGRAFDVRRDLPYAPYETLTFEVPVRHGGDVNDRIWIRILEVGESMVMIRQILERLQRMSGAAIAADIPMTDMSGGNTASVREGAALVEGFRGDIFAWVRVDESGRIGRCHMRDPSWFQWPLLEAVVEGNIVADFPLCNKSFNCSYAGHDG